jgi:hypothetical protein
MIAVADVIDKLIAHCLGIFATPRILPTEVSMRLEQAVHTALDEIRIQMLGTQVLFGFQLQGAFQERFAMLSDGAKFSSLAALVLLVCTLGLLLAAPAQHRMVECGNASLRIFALAGRFANRALFPLGAAIALDFFVVFSPYVSLSGAIFAGLLTGIVAAGLWYGFGHGVAHSIRHVRETKMPEAGRTSLHEKIDQMLTEARVVLPGAQALLGFQFAVTMTKAFGELDGTLRIVHFASLCFIALATAVLVTPATVHRIAFGGLDSERFHGIGSALVATALLPLASGISLDVYVASYKMIGDQVPALATAVVAFVVLTFFWYGLPLFVRYRSNLRVG